MPRSGEPDRLHPHRPSGGVVGCSLPGIPWVSCPSLGRPMGPHLEQRWFRATLEFYQVSRGCVCLHGLSVSPCLAVVYCYVYLSVRLVCRRARLPAHSTSPVRYGGTWSGQTSGVQGVDGSIVNGSSQRRSIYNKRTHTSACAGNCVHCVCAAYMVWPKSGPGCKGRPSGVVSPKPSLKCLGRPLP